jgi:ABC-2 type transport system permease protein
MISIPVVAKTCRTYWLLFAAILTLEFAFVNLFMVATNSGVLENSIESLRNLPFLRRFITVMIGSDLLDAISPTAITSFTFTHPLVWVLLISFCLTVASGSLAGEVDRGTMDLLAALPMSRTRIYASVSAMLVLFGLPLCWGAWAGVLAGRSLTDAGDVRMDALARVVCNLFAAYVLIAAFSLAISAASSRRGSAVAVSFFLVFYAFALNLLRAMWPELERLAWSGFLSYFQPLLIVRADAHRWRDLLVLVTASAVFWTIGLVLFRRRDIPAR